jgi:hypothetical protein
VSADWIRSRSTRELTVLAPTHEGLYREVTEAIGGLLGIAAEENDRGSADRLPVQVRAAAGAVLLAGYVEDLLYLIEIERFAPVRLERLVIDSDRLRAAVSGWNGDWSVTVGAVTGATVRYDGSRRQWRATVRFPG